MLTQLSKQHHIKAFHSHTSFYWTVLVIRNDSSWQSLLNRPVISESTPQRE